MRKKVYKYHLKATNEQDVIMPVHAKILTVAEQNGEIILYVIADLDSQMLEPRKIYIRGTRMDYEIVIDGDVKYIGTVKLGDGAYVFHVFEKVVE